MAPTGETTAVVSRKRKPDWNSANEEVYGAHRLQPTTRIGRGGSFYHLAQLMKYLNVLLAWFLQNVIHPGDELVLGTGHMRFRWMTCTGFLASCSLQNSE